MESYVGNPASKLKEAQTILSTIDHDIPSDRFFELGVNLSILGKIEGDVDRLFGLLHELDPVYASKPFEERKNYYDAIRVTRQIQSFLKTIRESPEGDVSKTKRLRAYVQELEDILEAHPAPADIDQTAETDQEESLPTGFPQTTSTPSSSEPNDSYSRPESRDPTRPPPRRDKFITKLNTHVTAPLGQLIFDFIKHPGPKPSSPIILGWLIIIIGIVFTVLVGIFTILLNNGMIDIEELIKFWQSIYPAK
jgi:hypothetical protein